MNTRIVLDSRVAAKDGTFPLKVAFSLSGVTAYLPLNIRLTLSQWDSIKLRVINHPQKAFLTQYVCSRKTIIDTAVLECTKTRNGRMTAKSLRDMVKRYLECDGDIDSIIERGTFAEHYLSVVDTKKKKTTRDIYMATYRRIKEYVRNIDDLAFEDITVHWLNGFDKFLMQYAPAVNARNIHFRNIRAVFNDAINEELTTHYPFRKFKIRPKATAKRSLTVDELRTLFDSTPIGAEQLSLDMFKLTFFLIGINTIDLLHLKNIVRGRIEYDREKTGRHYSIKVEPEAMDIITQYRGQEWLLSLLDENSNYRRFTVRINKYLQCIGSTHYEGRGGKKFTEPLFPMITTYWARHTWATIAAELDIPKETIAAALGHSMGNPTTAIYIDYNMRKVDEANRRVIDYVLYNKV